MTANTWMIEEVVLPSYQKKETSVCFTAPLDTPLPILPPGYWKIRLTSLRSLSNCDNASLCFSSVPNDLKALPGSIESWLDGGMPLSELPCCHHHSFDQDLISFVQCSVPILGYVATMMRQEVFTLCLLVFQFASLGP